MIEWIRPILDRPFFYEFYHLLVGATYRNRVLAEEYIRPQSEERLLDIGCGPGSMLPFLPPCHYMGFDANESYIAFAKKRYGERGEFVCDRVSNRTVQKYGTFDIVLAFGLIHHLDDSEARELFRLAYTALEPGGRMVTHDGCYAPNQSAAKRYMLSRDRGRFVRTQDQYERLARSSFNSLRTDLRDDVLRIPYSTLIMVCTR
jgi:cyclopropane fatty-acyl-phospholipid synthase-like methyltransferase